MTLEIKRSIAEVAGNANGCGDKCGTQSGAAILRPDENPAKLRDVDVAPHHRRTAGRNIVDIADEETAAGRMGARERTPAPRPYRTKGVRLTKELLQCHFLL